MDDLISRQAAIDAIDHICPVDTEYDCILLDRVDVRYVLSELPSAQPETKLIAEIKMSKEDVQSAIDEAIARMKKGKWVFEDGRPVNRTLEMCEIAICDQCRSIAPGYPFWECDLKLTNFCPNCGALMENGGKNE